MTKRAIAILAVLLVAGVAAWWVSNSGRDRPQAVAQEPDNGIMTDEERRQYVAEFVRVEDLKVGPDLKPDSDEVVPGLLRVTGQVVNEGDRAVETVIVAIFPKDETGAVMAMDQQDVVTEGALEPGETLEFRFQIRDRPGFAGAFDHDLR